MEDNDLKRKADEPLKESAKRLRIETTSELADSVPIPSGDKKDEDYHDENNEARDNDYDRPDSIHTPDTPLTSYSLKKYPSELKTIKCTWEGCEKTFNRPARLASHVRSHTNERPFQCPYDDCDKAYMEDKHLKQHIKGSHTHEREHVCTYEGCNKSFLTATRLRRHQAAHEGHERFRCTEYPPCNQTFRKHQTLQRHIRADHLRLTPFPCSYVDAATGIHCRAGYDSAGALRKHEDRVHGALRFWCDECAATSPVGFANKALLTKHMKAMHANCMFCDMKCSSERELQRHIETSHAGTPVMDRKNIACEYPGCGKAFTKKYNLTVHQRTAHEGERFICGITDLTGSAKLEGIPQHESCGKEFVSKVNLEDHVRTQHLGLASTVNGKRIKKLSAAPPPQPTTNDPIGALTGEAYIHDSARTIPCPERDCHWKFVREYDMQQHRRTHHDALVALQRGPHHEGVDPPGAVPTILHCIDKTCDWTFSGLEVRARHYREVHGHEWYIELEADQVGIEAMIRLGWPFKDVQLPEGHLGYDTADCMSKHCPHEIHTQNGNYNGLFDNYGADDYSGLVDLDGFANDLHADASQGNQFEHPTPLDPSLLVEG